MRPDWLPSSRAYAFVRIPLWRLTRAAVLALSLVSIPLAAGPVNAAPSASPASSAHVYLLRGVLNIFSLGLDDIAEKLRAQGIPVTIANFVSWSSLANEAAAEYRSGRIKTIVLVGHSSGATALPDMVARLNEFGTPVKLAIGLDSVFRTSLNGRVGKYINFYVANGAGTPVAKGNRFQGSLENVDVENVPGVGHLTIEKNQIMQQRVIAAIDAVVFNRATDASAVQRRSPEAIGTAAARN